MKIFGDRHYLRYALSRLANLIPSRPFRINIHDALEGMTDSAKDLRRHKVSTRSLLVHR